MDFIQQINPIQIYIYFTFIMALLFFKPQQEAHKILFVILLICVVTETVTNILVMQSKSVGSFVSMSIILHHTCWLILLYKSSRRRQWIKILIVGYLIFGIVNLFFLEGLERFNFYTFICGAFLYLVIFIYESFSELKSENFSFFTSNQYLLLFAPVLFLFGLSAVFGFKSHVLTTTTVIGNINLYQFINYFVNLIYYSSINIYIYREKMLRNAQ